MYLHSWTPVEKLRAWRCRSQQCSAFCRACWVCLCRGSCDSVQLPYEAFGIVRVLYFFRLCRWLPWCILITQNRGYVIADGWERTTRNYSLLDVFFSGDTNTLWLRLTIQRALASSCVAVSANWRDILNVDTPQGIKVSEKLATTDERSRCHARASNLWVGYSKSFHRYVPVN